MQRSIAIGALLIFTGGGAVGGPACRPSASATSSPSSSSATDPKLAREVLTFWNDLERKLVAMAEDFPEARYAFKPTPAVRSFAEILHHVAEENYVYVQTARGEAVDREALNRGVGSKRELARFLQQSFRQGAALLAKATDAQLLEPTTNPYGKRLTRLAFWLELVQHAAEHYGNLVTYYRLAGLVPPETRRLQQRRIRRPCTEARAAGQVGPSL